jgi:hypothetical protein
LAASGFIDDQVHLPVRRVLSRLVRVHCLIPSLRPYKDNIIALGVSRGILSLFFRWKCSRHTSFGRFFDHAWGIHSSIPPVQVVQSGAWEAITTVTVFDFGSHHLLTVLDAGHIAQYFDLKLSSPLQPGHAFFSLSNAQQRRQFIPQAAISFELVFANLLVIMTSVV